jgi:general secretion pathway protein K
MTKHAQRGVAAVTAILIVAVAASAATYMLAQQSATLNQAALVASRAQADLFAQAGLEWARGVLAQDARSTSIDSTDEPWAQPLAGLPVERAVVGGAITDAQGRYNLNNLVTNGQRSDADVAILRRLLESLQLNPDLALAVLDWVDLDSDVTGGAGAEDAFYLSLARPYRAANQPMAQVEELYRVRGFDAAAVAKLRPHVSALPGRTAVNANTASVEVLAAIMPELSLDEVNSLVQSRLARPFKDKADLASRAKKAAPGAIDSSLDVKSSYFSVRISVAQDDVQLAEEALVMRGANASTAIIWRHPLY